MTPSNAYPDRRAERGAMVEAARGDRPFDLVVVGARLVNVFTLETYPVDVGVVGRYVAYVGPAGTERLRANETIEADGRWLTPGLIDCHLHIESSMLTPVNFARAVLPRGTTAIYADPHELANVLGLDGVRYVLEDSANLPLKVFVQAPSCVPSVPGLEHAGAAFGGAEIAEMLGWPRVLGVAEVMDYVGVIAGAERMGGVVGAGLAAGSIVSGHAPRARGRALQAYLAAGIDSDHEATTADEMVEKLRAGMTIEGRAGSFLDDMDALVAAVRRVPAVPNVVLCTDDVEASDIIHVGHLDNVVRRAIAAGLDPALAIRCATLNAAWRLRQPELGAVAAGRRADLLLLDDLATVAVGTVIVDGRIVARGGHLTALIAAPPDTYSGGNTVRLPALVAADLVLRAPIPDGEAPVNAIDCTQEVMYPRLTTRTLPVRDGVVRLGGDVALQAVVRRHGQTVEGAPVALAPIVGFGLTRGAVASTVSHDSHNLSIVGANSDDMLLAARTLAACGGGIVAVADGQVLALVDLPIAGLLSPLPAEELAPKIDALKAACRDLGVRGDNPMLTIVLTALVVIPSVRMSDQGMVDVVRQELIPVFPSASPSVSS